VPFSKIVNRVGETDPIFNVSWTPSRLDIDVAQLVITFLERREILREPTEAPERSLQSALEIHEFLIHVLGISGIGEELADSLRAMRTACHKLIAAIGGEEHPGLVFIPGSAGLDERRGFEQARDELRTTIGHQIARLAVGFGLDVPAPLTSVLPRGPSGPKRGRPPGGP
jgi:hypothetical protein